MAYCRPNPDRNSYAEKRIHWRRAFWSTRLRRERVSFEMVFSISASRDVHEMFLCICKPNQSLLHHYFKVDSIFTWVWFPSRPNRPVSFNKLWDRDESVSPVPYWPIITIINITLNQLFCWFGFVLFIGIYFCFWYLIAHHSSEKTQQNGLR